VLDDLGRRLHVAVHHRRRGAHAHLVRRAVHVEPRLGAALLDGDALAHARGEDLGATAREGALAGLEECFQHATDREPAHLHHLVDLGGGEEVRGDLRVALPRLAHDRGVERPRDLGVQAALEQHRGGAHLAGGLHHAHDPFHVVRVAVGGGLADLAVERAEVAVDRAPVGVVGVGVDDVGDDARVGLSSPNLVGERAQLHERGVGEEVDALLGGQALTGKGLLLDAVPHGRAALQSWRGRHVGCGRRRYTAARPPNNATPAPEAGAGVASEACASRYFSRQDSVTNWLPYFCSICVMASPE
jgi:hypothetical protein